jgi:thiosulfate/3-mercaptopyruvate sulfurtransferase
VEEVTRDELVARLAAGDAIVLDVRSREEYEGLMTAPCDPRAGRIAGARHLDLQELLGLRPEQVRERVGAPEGAEVIAYCHSGSRSGLACRVLAAAGYRARNYAGSWHEWSRDPALPSEP